MGFSDEQIRDMLELKDIFQNSGDIADNVFSEMIKVCLEKSGSNTPTPSGMRSLKRGNTFLESPKEKLE